MLVPKITNRQITYQSRRKVLCRASATQVKRDFKTILEEKMRDKTLVVQVAPAVRVAISEGFNLKPGEISPQKLVTGLRNLGFAYVFDTVFSADVTILEEGTELLQRLKNGELDDKPMFTSCCPGWIQLAETSYPEILPCISTTKSPQMIMGSIVKHVFAETIGLKPDDIFMVSIMPCVRKQGEADRPMFGDDTMRDVDLVITTNELISLFKGDDIDLPNCLESEFDQPLGTGTGGATIFGKSGGVMIAALRFAYQTLTGKPLTEVNFTPVEGFQDIVEAAFDITPVKDNPIGLPSSPITLKIAVIHGLGGAKKFVKAVLDGKVDHKFIEIMACPSGCINGGGQPSVGKNKELVGQRREALTAFDDKADKKSSEENEDAQRLYEKHLGKPGEDKAHHLFHTHYEPKQK
jgi:iron-only hydrogenase group A